MIRLVVRRLAASAATVLLLSLLTFALLQSAPGGPGALLSDPSLRAADRARLERALGLDRPPLEQLGVYLSSLARGDLGISLSQHRPVSRVLAGALPWSLLLGAAALAGAFAIGLLIGTRAAMRPRGIAAWLVRVALPAVDAMPPFWLGMLAVLLFAWKLDWLPASHLRSAPGSPARWGPPLLDLLAHLILPSLVIAIPGAAHVARQHWAAIGRELSSPAILTNRALGLSEWKIVWQRATRVALQPAIVLLGLALPGLAGGAVVVEVVFSWPGLGRIQQAALLSRDVPLALGCVLVIGTLVTLGGLAADLLAAWADPRLRDSSS